MNLIKNKYVIFVACMLISAIIAFFIVPSQNKKSAGGEDVVRVVKTIEANTLITDNMLKVEKMVNPPSKVIRDKESIIGKFSAVTIYPEDNLVAEKFTDTDNKNQPGLYSIDGQNTFAVSVTVKNLASALSGKLSRGDVVSVYGFNIERKELIIDPDLRYIEVLSVSNNKAYDLDSSQSGDNSDDLIPSTVTLKVSATQAEKLVNYENTSNIHIVFAGRGETAQTLLERGDVWEN